MTAIRAVMENVRTYHVGIISVRDLPLQGAEAVPDGGSPAVFTSSSLDLEGRGGHSPEEVLRPDPSPWKKRKEVEEPHQPGTELG